jgi:mannose-6-phosphate isomerase-like protein (cupin superfamily)
LSHENKELPKVLYAGNQFQLEIQCLKIGAELGLTTNDESENLFSIISGIGKFVIAENVSPIKVGDLFIIPAGIKYNINNVSDEHHLKFLNLNIQPKTNDK